MKSCDTRFAERHEALLMSSTELYQFPICDIELFPRRMCLTTRRDLDIIASHSFQCGQIFVDYL
jgi:hypothetical protein